MRKPSMKDLGGQVAAGTYAVDAAEVAGKMLSDFALVRRVGRELKRQDGSNGGGLGDQDRPRERGARASSRSRQTTKFR